MTKKERVEHIQRIVDKIEIMEGLIPHLSTYARCKWGIDEQFETAHKALIEVKDNLSIAWTELTNAKNLVKGRKK